MPAQETSAPDAPLAGEAGQMLALPDVTSFGGSLSVASLTPVVSNVGRLLKGECVNRRIIVTSGCKLKMVMAHFGDKNSAKIQKKVVRGATDFNGTLTANFDGQLVITTFKQSSGTCSMFVDDTFSSGANC